LGLVDRRDAESSQRVDDVPVGSWRVAHDYDHAVLSTVRRNLTKGRRDVQ
jgi:hypothetical protein